MPKTMGEKYTAEDIRRALKELEHIDFIEITEDSIIINGEEIFKFLPNCFESYIERLKISKKFDEFVDLYNDNPDRALLQALAFCTHNRMIIVRYAELKRPTKKDLTIDPEYLELVTLTLIQLLARTPFYDTAMLLLDAMVKG